MSDFRINFIDNWEKKEVNLLELKKALEDGNSSVYSAPRFRKVSAKWKKYKERGISNLYLLKELDDDGVACERFVRRNFLPGRCGHTVLFPSRTSGGIPTRSVPLRR